MKEPLEEERIAAEGKAVLVHLVKWMVEQGGDLRHVDGAGQTALHLGARFAGEKTMRLLLDAGLDLNMLNRENAGIFLAVEEIFPHRPNNF